MKTLALLLVGLALAFLPAEAQQSPEDYYDSAQEEFVGGKFNDAWTDFSLYTRLEPKGEYADYAHLFIWLTRLQLKQKGDADTDLAEAREKSWNTADDGWVSKIADFFLDKISEADLLAAADVAGDETPVQQHCEAWYYAGMKRLLSGDKATAITYFHKCVATKVSDFTEYAFAVAELKALGEKN